MNDYQYSIRVDEALASYGAKTFGTLERRVARLSEFTTFENNRVALAPRTRDERMSLRQERKDNVRRNLAPEFEGARYNLRSRTDTRGLNLLVQAIENGFVTTRRG